VEFECFSFEVVKQEGEVGQRHFDGGNEGGGAVLRFHFHRAWVGGQRRRTVQRCTGKAAVASGNWRWGMTPCWADSADRPESLGPVREFPRKK
jgi:hypothetical protein